MDEIDMQKSRDQTTTQGSRTVTQ